MEVRTDWLKYRERAMAFTRGLARPALGLLRYVATLALFCAVWWYDARYLNRLFDLNLTIIKGGSGLIDGSGKLEAMLRAFAAEKMLLFGEGSALLWGVGKGVSIAATRLCRWWPGADTAAKQQPRAPRLASPSRDSIGRK